MSTNPFVTGEAWRHFLSLEKSLGEFVEYVPLDRRNQNVFSPRLGTILIGACTQIESTFKAIINANYLDNDKSVDGTKLQATRKAIQKGKGNLNQYRDLLEPYFLLSKRKVTIRQPFKVYKRTYPFKKSGYRKAPSWWKSYTDLKHSFYDNIRQATLRRVFLAVGALFLIQIMHLDHRKILIDLGVIKSGRTDSQVEGLSPLILTEVLSSSPREIDKDFLESGEGILVNRIWAETDFFEMDF